MIFSRRNTRKCFDATVNGNGLAGADKYIDFWKKTVKYPAHTYTHIMATRTINLSEESYTRLRSLKKGNESFSDVVNRITGKFLLLELAGILDKDSAERLRKAKREMDRRLRKSLRKASSGMA
jgi:predicted CopG family antitoxin